MGIVWIEASIKDYAAKNGLVEDLKKLFRDNGWSDDGDIQSEYFKGFEFKRVSQEGGEGCGETYYLVYEITYPDAHKEFWKLDLAWYSYDGVQWDGWFESFYKVKIKKITRDEWVKHE